MATLTYETGRVAYPAIVNEVLRHGSWRTPRGMGTYDLGPTTVVLESAYDALPLGVGRKLNTAIAAAEAVQLVAAHARHDLLPRITPAFAQYAEEDGRFHGAYGDRIHDQVAQAIGKIMRDRHTRQAVVTLWDRYLDNASGYRDYPCTVALNFALVRGKLEARVLMRSNDVWLGFPYDIFQFTQLQLTVAHTLDVEPGPYHHTAWSLHIYEKHVELADQLEFTGESHYQPRGFGTDGDTWRACRGQARSILFGDPVIGLTESERWYVEQLGPYVSQTDT